MIGFHELDDSFMLYIDFFDLLFKLFFDFFDLLFMIGLHIVNGITIFEHTDLFLHLLFYTTYFHLFLEK